MKKFTSVLLIVSMLVIFSSCSKGIETGVTLETFKSNALITDEYDQDRNFVVTKTDDGFYGVCEDSGFDTVVTYKVTADKKENVTKIVCELTNDMACEYLNSVTSTELIELTADIDSMTLATGEALSYVLDCLEIFELCTHVSSHEKGVYTKDQIDGLLALRNTEKTINNWSMKLNIEEDKAIFEVAYIGV